MNHWDRAVVWVGLHPETAAIVLVMWTIALVISGGILLMRWFE